MRQLAPIELFVLETHGRKFRYIFELLRMNRLESLFYLNASH